MNAIKILKFRTGHMPTLVYRRYEIVKLELMMVHLPSFVILKFCRVDRTVPR